MKKYGLKTAIRAITPPALREAISEIRNHGSLRYFGKTYQGVFTTFEEAAMAFGEAVPYHSAESERKEAADAAHSREEADRAHRGTPPGTVIDRYTLLCGLVSEWPHPSPTVLDIGGGTGSALAHLIYSCPRHTPRLIVQDLPPIILAGRNAFFGENAISFIDDIASAKPPVDIVFFGSSLHYIEDYETALNRAAALKPRLIMIGTAHVTNAPTFVTAQVNMRHRIMPNKFINFDELVAHMRSLGFELAHRSKSEIGAHFKNFSEPWKDSMHANLVFVQEKRKSGTH